MKNDLKTFPVKASPQDYERWKKAFEKELRIQLVYGEKCEKAWRGANNHRVDEEIAMEWQGANQKTKEILG